LRILESFRFDATNHRKIGPISTILSAKWEENGN